MVTDIHKAIISNPISKNLLKPWASNANPNSLRSKLSLLINIQILEIQLKTKLIFIHLQVKYTKSMIHH